MVPASNRLHAGSSSNYAHRAMIALCMAVDRAEHQPESAELLGWLEGCGPGGAVFRGSSHAESHITPTAPMGGYPLAAKPLRRLAGDHERLRKKRHYSSLTTLGMPPSSYTDSGAGSIVASACGLIHTVLSSPMSTLISVPSRRELLN